MEEVTAWKLALQRCIETQRFGVVEDDVVLVYVDGSRVFYAPQTLVNFKGNEQNDRALVAVLRFHPRVSTLLRSLQAKHTDEMSSVVKSIFESVVFRDQSSVIFTGSMDTAAASSAIKASPVAWPCAVNVEGGGLRFYADTDEAASHALMMIALAMIQGEDRPIDSNFEPFVAVVEHRDGYTGREFFSRALASPSATEARVFSIQKQDWNGGSVAQVSLDDALEEYEELYRQEREINGDVVKDDLSLEIDVTAAFEVRDQARWSLETAFRIEREWNTSQSTTTEPVVLYSEWSGLENVRSLLCKPPPRCASTLCISLQTNACSARPSLTLLEHLEEALRDGDMSRSWRSSTHDKQDDADTIKAFKRLIKNIDDDSYGITEADEDTTNNTIETTVSMALNEERQRGLRGQGRKDLDAVEKVWEFLARNATSIAIVLQLVQDMMVSFSNTRIVPTPHAENNTKLANVIRKRHEEIHGGVTSHRFSAIVHNIISHPQSVIASVIETGEWKMKRDVAFALTQAGFSSPEAADLVQAIPYFDAPDAGNEKMLIHWRAMDHVLQLCATGRAIQLPVAFMRKAVHECIGFYRERTEEVGMPAAMIDLQSFIPERLRANIADPLHWDLRMAFSDNYEHRVRICQSTVHPTISCRNRSSLFTLEDDASELNLDDATVRALKANMPDEILLDADVAQFLTKLEEDRDKHIYHQLHDYEMPTGTARYDCRVRKLKTT